MLFMIRIENAKNIAGKVVTQEIESRSDRIIDASGLTMMRALTDPHVHFRTPGFPDKEDFATGSLAAIHGGVTTVFDMPNTKPATTTEQALKDKKNLIDSQLTHSFRYELFLGADKGHFDEIAKVRDEIVGLKVYMGSTTGNLTMDDDSSLHAAFSLASAHDLMVVVHAEDEAMIAQRSAAIRGKEFQTHTDIRSPEVAVKATEKAIALAEMYNTRLYIAHLSTLEEIPLIAQAKKRGVQLFAETSPHHLFLDETAYNTHGAKAQVNPPIREKKHGEALLQALEDGIIDTVGSDHAPHTVKEKKQAYGKAPSGIPGIQTMLPLLLNAVNQGKLSLERLHKACCVAPRTLFSLPLVDDWVLIDLEEKRVVQDEDMQSKAKWSPFTGRTLQGWPKYTICKGEVFTL
jgi:dihydroorotase